MQQSEKNSESPDASEITESSSEEDEETDEEDAIEEWDFDKVMEESYKHFMTKY